MSDLPDLTAADVKAFRASAGLTQERLARVLNISYATCVSWERKTGPGAPGHWRWAFAAIAGGLQPWSVQ